MPSTLGNFGAFALGGLLPIDETIITGGPLKPFVETLANYDFFRQRPIESPYQRDLILELRKDRDRASRVGAIISEAVGVDGLGRPLFSSQKVDHLVEGLFGGLGKLGLRTSDLGREDRPSPGRRLINEAAGVLTTGPLYSAPDVQFVLSWGRSRGLSGSEMFRSLQENVSALYQTDDPQTREELGRLIREQAATLREVLEDFE